MPSRNSTQVLLVVWAALMIGTIFLVKAFT
jgi:hypothetical protein